MEEKSRGALSVLYVAQYNLYHRPLFFFQYKVDQLYESGLSVCSHPDWRIPFYAANAKSPEYPASDPWDHYLAFPNWFRDLGEER